MTNPAVSVVIPNYNGRRYLEGCVNSLLAQEFQDFEIVLVDNASTDDSLQFLRQRYPGEIAGEKLRLIVNPANTGYAGGNNTGVRHARGRWVVILNNDTEVAPDWLRELTRAFGDNCATVSVMGSLPTDIGFQPQMPELFLRDKLTLTMTLCGETVFRAQDEDEVRSPLKPVFFAGGAAIIFSKEEIPVPFDDDYFAYAEDGYLGWMVRLRGREVRVCTTAKLLHFGCGTKKQSKAIFNLTRFHGTKNMALNLLLFYRWGNLLRIAPLYCLTQLGRIAHEPALLPVTLRAWGWIVCHWRDIMAKRRAIQARRVVSDRDIIRQMSCKFFEESLFTSPVLRRAIGVMNKLFYAYCLLTGIRTREFFR